MEPVEHELAEDELDVAARCRHVYNKLIHLRTISLIDVFLPGTVYRIL